MIGSPGAWSALALETLQVKRQSINSSLFPPCLLFPALFFSSVGHLASPAGLSHSVLFPGMGSANPPNIAYWENNLSTNSFPRSHKERPVYSMQQARIMTLSLKESRHVPL